MSQNQFSVVSCPTCNGSGFVWRRLAMKHETIFMCQGKPAVHIHVSRIKNLCPECRGTGVPLSQKRQHACPSDEGSSFRKKSWSVEVIGEKGCKTNKRGEEKH
jgi:DnaJ-class molecular chaperone